MPANTTDSDWFYYETVSAYLSTSCRALHNSAATLGKYLHEDRSVYALFGALDGLSMSYSTTKYSFDMWTSRYYPDINAGDDMHFWMLTPEGVLTMIIETIMMITVSTYANMIDDDELHALEFYQVALEKSAETKQLALSLENGVIHCVTQNKRNQTEQFVIQDCHLDSDAEAIKCIIASGDLSALTETHKQKIGHATTYRNDVRTRYEFYIRWRQLRDALKGLKNAYKGLRVTLWAAGLLTKEVGQDWLVPSALILGVLSASNRIWYRSMKDARKKFQAYNKNLAEIIKKKNELSAQEEASYLQKIRSHSADIQHWGLASQAFGGVIDGLYLYMGVLTLAPLTAWAFSYVALVSALFVTLCIFTRVYGEYEYQRKLASSEQLVKIQLYCLREKTIFKEANDALEESSLVSDELSASLSTYVNKFEAAYAEYLKQNEHSWWLTGLSGLRDGLLVGSAIGNLLFAVSTVLSMLSVATCPAWLVLAFVSFSLGLVVCGPIAALTSSATTAPVVTTTIPNIVNPDTPAPDTTNSGSLMSLLEQLKMHYKNGKGVITIGPDDIERAAWNAYDLKVTPLQTWENWAEILRSFFAGVRNGIKSADFTLNPLQEIGDDGHCYDSNSLVGFGILYSAVFAIILMGRALAKELNDQCTYEANTPDHGPLVQTAMQEQPANPTLTQKKPKNLLTDATHPQTLFKSPHHLKRSLSCNDLDQLKREQQTASSSSVFSTKVGTI